MEALYQPISTEKYNAGLQNRTIGERNESLEFQNGMDSWSIEGSFVEGYICSGYLESAVCVLSGASWSTVLLMLTR